eukprot:TRINITY_DN75953_c0_g1_i1.p1 TRINITY_DN75953_c0_g1~~TRINITY_DN75953_c0_g1_i1.p1  ORF type:complete len:291 (-),score=27.31 TRINITY_DN75953_c0_g1_i1:218-1018(-)
MSSCYGLTQGAEGSFAGELEVETEAPTDSEISFGSDASSEPLRLPVIVKEADWLPLLPLGEPAKLFGFDHLAPASHKSDCSLPRQTVAFPQHDSGLEAHTYLESTASSSPPSTGISSRFTHKSDSSWGTSSTLLVEWTVDARRLNSKNSVIVSPSFEWPVANSTPFKIMLCPIKMSPCRGGVSFSKSRGVGTVQLKCDACVPREMGLLNLRCSVGQQSFGRHQSHDFSQCGVFHMPHAHDFGDAVNAFTKSFSVKLEISGLREETR